MRTLIVFGIVGFFAQLVDGSLGMAYGVTTSTLLLSAGYAPAAASASVHLAELGTTLASGFSHHKFGNVNWAVVRRIGVPGAIGAFAGATFLSSLSTEAARPWMAAILLVLGLYVLVRFAARHSAGRRRPHPPATTPRAARTHGRLHRRHGRRRLGTSRHPDADDRREDGAAQGHRLGVGE